MNNLNLWAVAVTGIAIVLAVGVGAGVQAQPANAEQDRSFKQRRIIVNDDGEVPGLSSGRTMEDYLATRFTDTVNTQVDSYFLCVGSTDRGPGARPDPPRVQDTQNLWFPEMKLPVDVDKLTRTYLKVTREAGMEIFASFRMNDIHDAWAPKLTYPLKVQRPDLLLGEKHVHKLYPEDAVMRSFWSGFDYARPEVRQHFLDFILSYCRQYDYDGVELDYFRHPLFFKLGHEAENMDKMTEFVRQIREGLDEIGRERGKPYLLAVRVPDTPVMALRTGLDVERWLKEGLVDMLIVAGGYMPFGGRVKEFIDMAHRYGVPAYPATNVFSDVRQTHSDPAKIVRSYASNFWVLGGDGVYIFNYYGVEDGSEHAKCLNQLGDPDILLGLDKQYLPDNGCSIIWCGLANLPGQFPAAPYVPGVTWRINPVWIIDGTPIELVVGDDVQQAAREGLLAEMRLQVKVSDMDESEGITLKVNGVPVPAADIERVAEDSFEATVSAPPLRQGINHIVVLPGPHSLGRLSSAVTWLELSVGYKHD